MIPTAEEYLANTGALDADNVNKNVTETMIEFAKIHVEAALNEIYEKAEIETHYPNPYTSESYERVNRQSILNAYPLTNIK